MEDAEPQNPVKKNKTTLKSSKVRLMSQISTAKTRSYTRDMKKQRMKKVYACMVTYFRFGCYAVFCGDGNQDNICLDQPMTGQLSN